MDNSKTRDRFFENWNRGFKVMINIEYERLKSLFSLVDESKTELVNNLIYQAAFMKVELDKL